MKNSLDCRRVTRDGAGRRNALGRLRDLTGTTRIAHLFATNCERYLRALSFKWSASKPAFYPRSAHSSWSLLERYKFVAWQSNLCARLVSWPKTRRTMINDYYYPTPTVPPTAHCAVCFQQPIRSNVHPEMGKVPRDLQYVLYVVDWWILFEDEDTLCCTTQFSKFSYSSKKLRSPTTD